MPTVRRAEASFTEKIVVIFCFQFFVLCCGIITAMQYEVPQFIEVEDKIFGPLTFKQFLYVAGAAGACVALLAFLPLWLAVPIGLPIAGLGAALAFYKVNGRPLVEALENAFGYFTESKLYLWKQRPKEAAARETAAPVVPSELPRVTESKLRNLAWSLNIKDRSVLGVAASNPEFEV